MHVLLRIWWTTALWCQFARVCIVTSHATFECKFFESNKRNKCVWFQLSSHLYLTGDSVEPFSSRRVFKEAIDCRRTKPNELGVSFNKHYWVDLCQVVVCGLSRGKNKAMGEHLTGDHITVTVWFENGEYRIVCNYTSWSFQCQPQK